MVSNVVSEKTALEMRAGERALTLQRLLEKGEAYGLKVATLLHIRHDIGWDVTMVTMKVTTKDGTTVEFTEPRDEFPSEHLVAKLGLLT